MIERSAVAVQTKGKQNSHQTGDFVRFKLWMMYEFDKIFYNIGLSFVFIRFCQNMTLLWTIMWNI